MQATLEPCGFQLPKLRPKPNTRKSRSKNQEFNIFEETARFSALPEEKHNGQNTAKRAEETPAHRESAETASVPVQAVSSSNEANTKRRRSPPTPDWVEARVNIGRQSQNKTPTKMPLVTTSRPLQARQTTADRAGSGDGKENVPPEYLSAWQKNSSRKNLCSYNGLYYKFGISDQGMCFDTVNIVTTSSTVAIAQDVHPVASIATCTDRPACTSPNKIKDSSSPNTHRKETKTHPKAGKDRTQATSSKAKETVQPEVRPPKHAKPLQLIYSAPLTRLLNRAFELFLHPTQAYRITAEFKSPILLQILDQSWTLSITTITDKCKEQTHSSSSLAAAVPVFEPPDVCVTNNTATNCAHNALITSYTASQSRSLLVFFTYHLHASI